MSRPPSPDRVGGTNGFLKLPHVYPRSESHHAANARELERVVNNIPAGSPPKVFYGDIEDMPGDGTELPFTVLGDSITPVSFVIPGGTVRWEVGLTYRCTGSTISATTVNTVDPIQGDLRGLFGILEQGIGTSTVLTTTSSLITNPAPQEIRLLAGATTASGTDTSELAWVVTVTPITPG